MIAQKPSNEYSLQMESLNNEELVDFIVRADLPVLRSDVANRLTYSDPVTLRRLAFLAMLSTFQREDRGDNQRNANYL